MRSIRYILSGKPSRLDDCIDYADHHPVQRIELTLQTPEQVTEIWTARWLQGRFTWFFEGGAVACERAFGGCFQHEPSARQLTSVHNANARLLRELDAIRDRLGDVPIDGADRRFDESAVYQPQTAQFDAWTPDQL